MADEESLVELFWVVGRALRHSARDALAEWSLSPSQARALDALTAHGQIRLGELAQRLRIAPRSATEVVDQLEERGLVRRAPDPEDRRATMVQLTDEGTATSRAIGTVRADQARLVFDLLEPADQAELTRLLSLLGERTGTAAGHRGDRSGGPGGGHGSRGGHGPGRHHGRQRH